MKELIDKIKSGKINAIEALNIMEVNCENDVFIEGFDFHRRSNNGLEETLTKLGYKLDSKDINEIKNRPEYIMSLILSIYYNDDGILEWISPDILDKLLNEIVDDYKIIKEYTEHISDKKRFLELRKKSKYPSYLINKIADIVLY